MMIKRKTLIAGGIILGVGSLGVLIYLLTIKRKRNNRAALALSQIERRYEAKEASQKARGFDPEYWKTSGEAKISQGLAQKYADTLYSAKGFINDEEEDVSGVYRSLPTATAQSQVASAFMDKHSQDLLNYLKSFLSEEEFAEHVGNYLKY